MIAPRSSGLTIPGIVILILIQILGHGAIPATVAIAIHTTSARGKLFSGNAKNADLKPVEVLASVRANWSQRMGLGILRQIARNWFSCALQRFELDVPASAILGFVGRGRHRLRPQDRDAMGRRVP